MTINIISLEANVINTVRFFYSCHSLLDALEEGAIMTVKEKISANSLKNKVSKKQKFQPISKCRFCLRNMSTDYLKKHVVKFCKSKSRNWESLLLQELLDNDDKKFEIGKLIHDVICNSQHRIREEELVPDHKLALEMYRSKVQRRSLLMARTLKMYKRKIQCCGVEKSELHVGKRVRKKKVDCPKITL